jgi:predicted PurR-regulated permease PerM
LSDAGSPRRRTVFLAVSAICIGALIIAARQILLPFVLALVVAYVLTPAVRRVERQARVPRWAAILLVYALTLGTIGGFVALIVPRLVSEGQGLAAEWPHLTQKARANWLPAIDARLSAWSGRPVEPEPKAPANPGVDVDAPASTTDDKPPPFRLVRQPDGSFDVRIADGVQFREKRDGVWAVEQVERRRGLSSAVMVREGFDKAVAYLQENSMEVLKIGREVVFAVVRSVFMLVWTLMLAAYLMLTQEKIFAFLRELAQPSSRSSVDRFLRRLDRGLSGVVRGQLVICVVNGVLSAIGFSLFGLKYWPILALLAGVMSLIPIFGSILSSVPVVAIGLTQSPATAVGVLAWILGIHQLEANFLNPKIIGDAAKIHPVLVVFSLMAGEHFFQLPGALFAVPAMSVAQTIFLHFRETALGIADPTASIIPPARRATDVSEPTVSPED